VPEATTSAVHRAALKSDSARVTALTNLFSGRPARGIVNRIMRELGPISLLPPAFPLATSAIAPLRAKAEGRGNGDFSPLWAGQKHQRLQGGAGGGAHARARERVCSIVNCGCNSRVASGRCKARIPGAKSNVRRRHTCR
jgi:NAD(P)H-dependent flavin oxidoreductase YrpB (nitropropane dioxygenase family)